MATASFDPGETPRRLPVSLGDVDEDMRAIFGGGGVPVAASTFQARVRAVPPPTAARSPWGRVAAVLVTAGGAGALLGWWVLATPQGNLARVRTPAPVHTARGAFPAAPLAATVAPDEVASSTAPEGPVADDGGFVGRARVYRDERYDRAAVPAPTAPPEPPVAYAAIPAPAPDRVPFVAAPPPAEEAPRYADTRAPDDACGRYADACTFADVRDAEYQFRGAYAAAVSAGADPRALADVRRRWARLRALDDGQPDLLVTDFARLSGRLASLADAAYDLDDARR